MTQTRTNGRHVHNRMKYLKNELHLHDQNEIMNDYPSDSDQNDEIENSKRKKLIYPTWRGVTIECIREARKKNPEIFQADFSDYNKIFEKLDMVKDVIEQKHPVNLIHFLSEADASYEPRLSFETVFESFKSISVRPNEFYAVFDLYQFQHKEVDPKIKKILGLNPEDFTLPAMAGFIPENPLFHKRDVNHVLRWASIAYYMFTLRLFKWNSMEDQYRVRFRVGTKKSSLPYFQERGYAALEKLCFLFYDRTDDGSTRPIYHFDKWLVYDENEFDYVKPSWISNFDRQPHLNNFLYLVNAYLLDFSPQYLLLLHLKDSNERNKGIANALNEAILKATGINAQADERQVADCFAKTIRNKVTETMNFWDKRDQRDLECVVGDTQAVNLAKTLGLLPIPESVLKMLYSGITAV
jgi:hypothetical protein